MSASNEPAQIRPPEEGQGAHLLLFRRRQAGDGSRELIALPHIKDPRFGGALARAKATRTNRRNRDNVLTLDGLIRLYEKSPEFQASRAESTKRSYSRYLAKANSFSGARRGIAAGKQIEKSDIINLRDQLADTKGAATRRCGRSARSTHGRSTTRRSVTTRRAR
jgi:hypothetical protein